VVDRVVVLVTGGAGFIGSHLCERLLASGAVVTCLDDFSTGRRANLATFATHPRFHLVEADVSTDVPDVAVDRLYHLASVASPVAYRRDPLAALRANAFGTFGCLELARRHGARFLFASTSEVYGQPQRHPQAETDWGQVNPVGPRAMYVEGKRFAEAATVSFADVYGLDVRIARIFNTYGPRNDPDDGRLVPNLVTHALRGEPLPVEGDGIQTRSLCYVGDLVDGLVALMEAPDAAREVFNLGSPDEHTVLEYAQLIARMVGSTAPIVHNGARAEEVVRRCPDITKARTRLGWQPRTPLDQGLAETIAWYRAIYLENDTRDPQREGRSVMANVNPIDVERHLSGVSYPASKQALLDEADEQGAGEDIRSALAQLPDDEYDSPAAVSKALSQID
jgi:UDP-glucuronate decarboxylase